MGRPPVFSPETETRIVLSVLSGEVSVAEAARKEKVSEQWIGRFTHSWDQHLDALATEPARGARDRRPAAETPRTPADDRPAATTQDVP